MVEGLFSATNMLGYRWLAKAEEEESLELHPYLGNKVRGNVMPAASDHWLY
jgi:hypothetical protein